MNDWIVAIIQARMGSSRLPGKVLLDLAGHPMLDWVVNRARQSKLINQIIVATTNDSSDDLIATWCVQQNVPYHRGSLKDVLDRYYQSAKRFNASIVVRFTADCPLLDPGVVDETIEAFLREKVDFAANRLPPPFKRTYPIGLDTEVCSFKALERAWIEAAESHEREHVMPYLYDTPGRFRIYKLDYKEDYGSLRWTVDTQEDLKLIRQIIARFNGRMDFSWLEVLEIFKNEPELACINAQVQHKTYLDVDNR